MKTTIKPIIAALLLGTTFFVNAKTLPASPNTIKPFAYSMYKNQSESSINLFINKLKGSKLNIELKNEKGDVIYTTGLGKNDTNYRTKLNLSELSTGTYFLEIRDGQNIEKRKIEIKEERSVESLKIEI